MKKSQLQRKSTMPELLQRLVKGPVICAEGLFDLERRGYLQAGAYVPEVVLDLCCGAGPHHIRALAEALGRHPPASHYSTDMSKHYIFGQTEGLREQNLKYARRG